MSGKSHGVIIIYNDETVIIRRKEIKISTILFHKNYSRQGLFGIPSITQNYYKYRNFSKSHFNFN
jgi:hypothetical protein